MISLQRRGDGALTRGIVAHSTKRPETAKSGDTGWLGCQDSNLEMLFWKTPFEMSRGFRLNSEHIATRDSSPFAAEIARSTLEVR